MYRSEKYCKNCGQHLILNQKFCHNCGQNAETHRINFHFLLHEIQHGIFHVDKGIFYTLKELFTRPGHTIREYIEGRRQNHFKPALLIMILGTVTILLNHWINNEGKLLGNPVIYKQPVNGGSDENKEILKITGALLENFSKVANWISEHYAISLLLMIPFFSFAFWLAFKKYRLNFPEWLVISTFITAQSMVLYILLIVIPKRIVDLGGLFILSFTAISIWTLIQYFYQSRKREIILRSLLSLFIYYVLFLAVVIIFILIIVLNNR